MSRFFTTPPAHAQSGRAALPALEKAFDSGEFAFQWNALKSIGAIESPRRVKVLAVALESTYRPTTIADNEVPSEKSRLRARIVYILHNIKGEEAQRLLIVLAEREKDPYVIDSIRELGKKRDVDSKSLKD